MLSGFYCLPSSSRFFAEFSFLTNDSKTHDCALLPFAYLIVFFPYTDARSVTCFSSGCNGLLLIRKSSFSITIETNLPHFGQSISTFVPGSPFSKRRPQLVHTANFIEHTSLHSHAYKRLNLSTTIARLRSPMRQLLSFVNTYIMLLERGYGLKVDIFLTLRLIYFSIF